jgi:hypothetical protein
MTSLNDATTRLLFACLDRVGLKISKSTTFMSQPLAFRRESADLNGGAVHFTGS